MNTLNILLTQEDHKPFVEYWNSQLSELAAPFIVSAPLDDLSSGSALRIYPVSLSVHDAAIGRIANDPFGRYIVLAGMVAIVMHRFSGSKIIVLDTPPLIKEQNTYNEPIPLVLSIDKTDTLRSVIGKVKQKVVENFNYQDFPVASLAKLQHPDAGCVTNILMWSPHIHSEASFVEAHDLVLEMDLSEKPALAIKYDTARFGENWIAQFGAAISSCCNFLQSIHTSVEDVRLITEEEHHIVLEYGRGDEAEFTGDTVTGLITRRALAYPGDIAVVENNVKLSYEQLVERSDKLAHYLSNFYLEGRKAVVGILMDRSVDFVVSVLAAMKAGCTFLPLDTEAPLKRNLWILNNARVEVLLTVTDHIFELEGFGGKVMAVDVQSEYPDEKVSRLPENSPGDIAYIIYTSGSTGDPKGVQITHKSLANYVQWAVSRYFDRPGSGNTALITSPAFDLTLTALFCPLVAGGSIVIYGRQEVKDILTHIAGSGTIDTLKITPAYVQLFHQLGWKKFPVKQIILGGEPLTPAHVSIIRELGDDIRIFNEYGPTETTIGCTVAEIQQDITIGKPIANTRIYLLDKYLQLLPRGVEGEIYIAGAGVSLGYLGISAEVSSAKFMPDPYSPGSTMYRSGDLGSWSSNGELRYHGRADEQVKLNGFRVELGEVEAILKKQEGIKDAVAVVMGNGDPAGVLVAYIVGENVDADRLKEQLAQWLPSYMVPLHLINVPAIPLTTNGKVNRKLLPSLAEYLKARERLFIAPATDTEIQLSHVLASLLQLEQVSTTDSFFELGGNSLLAVKYSADIKGKLLVNVSVAEIFENLTIQKLAKLIEQRTFLGAEEDDLNTMIAEIGQLTEEEINKLLNKE